MQIVKDLFITFVSLVNSLNEMIFAPVDSLMEKLPFNDWIIDGIIDSLHMLPFLFLIFVVIEFVEYFGLTKLNKVFDYSQKSGPLLGSLAASFPQCGFSVIASTLYTKKMITKGTLLAVYLATSDEAIPVIMAEPEKIYMVVPLLLTKIFIAILAGYLIDFVLDIKHRDETVVSNSDEDDEPGCCHHHVSKPRKRDLLYHPLAHTLNVFVFILVVTLGINGLVEWSGGEENIGKFFMQDSVWQPIITAIAGLIPNCAISVAITLLYLKGAIGFGSVISGLCSGAGLGLLVLLKKNNLKDTLKILILLLFISMFCGILIQALYN